MHKRQITLTIKHIEITSSKTYEQVTALLEEKMSSANGDMGELIEQLVTSKTSWVQATNMIEKRLGKSGFRIFCKIDHGLLLSLKGKPTKAVQYTLGNPLLAVQMTEHDAAVALYAPLKLAVYENDNAGITIIYDSLASIVSSFGNEEINRIAEQVDSTLEELLSTVI